MNIELYLSYEILKKVYIDNAFSQIELNNSLSENNEKNVNSALVTKIVYGVLDNNILLEYFLKQFYTKKPKNKVLIILKIGAYVSKFLDSIPNFALVNELVNISKKIDKGVSGFVNSTLKNILKAEIKLPDKNNLKEYLSIKHSYPLWLIDVLIKDLGVKFTQEFLEHNLTNQTHVRVNLNETTATEFEKNLEKNNIKFEKSSINNAYYVNYSNLIDSNISKTHYIVMGLTSMNLCEIIAPKNKTSILDACASPGGKSVYLAQLSKSSNITSADLHSHRVDLIKSYTHKYNIKNINPIVQDATIFNEKFKEKFDYVLLDVPCSGIGVVQKRPDIFLNRSEASINDLSLLQLEILKNNAKYVKVGGELFYSTCTILKQENEGVVLKFLSENNNFKLEKITQPNSLKAINRNEMLTYYPNISNSEGFFIAKLKKIS